MLENYKKLYESIMGEKINGFYSVFKLDPNTNKLSNRESLNDLN